MVPLEKYAKYSSASITQGRDVLYSVLQRATLLFTGLIGRASFLSVCFLSLFSLSLKHNKTKCQALIALMVLWSSALLKFARLELFNVVEGSQYSTIRKFTSRQGSESRGGLLWRRVHDKDLAHSRDSFARDWARDLDISDMAKL